MTFNSGAVIQKNHDKMGKFLVGNFSLELEESKYKAYKINLILGCKFFN